MDLSPVRHFARQVGLWSLLVLGVSLSTLLFNILGTISAAVIAAMVMGAYRRLKWEVIPVSLVFPLVGLILAQVSKSGLEPRQYVAMVALCFGAFWAVYLPALFLMCMEKDHSAAQTPTTAAPARGAVEESRRKDGSQETACPVGVTTGLVSENVEPLSLRDLQGSWVCETSDLNGHPFKRTLEIAEDKFALNVLNSNGPARVVARGDIRLERVATANTLVIR